MEQLQNNFHRLNNISIDIDLTAVDVDYELIFQELVETGNFDILPNPDVLVNCEGWRERWNVKSLVRKLRTMLWMSDALEENIFSSFDIFVTCWKMRWAYDSLLNKEGLTKAERKIRSDYVKLLVRIIHTVHIMS